MFSASSTPVRLAAATKGATLQRFARVNIVVVSMEPHRLYIGGEFVAARAPGTLTFIDPSTTEIIATVPDAGADDVDRAVGAARAAFDDGRWKDATAQDRGRVLFKLAN